MDWFFNFFDKIDPALAQKLMAYDAQQPLLFNTGLFMMLFLDFVLIYQAMRRWRTAKMVVTILFSLYFYYIIGMGLEARWGKVKFNLYYLVGMAAAVIACLITGYASNSYLNLSLFFAYAAMYPDEEVLLFMLLPVKMKILALIDAALYTYYFIVGNASTRVTIALCLLNVILFLGGDILNTLRRESRYWKTRYNFRKTMRK